MACHGLNRRSFLKTVAAGAAAQAGVTGLGGCGDPTEEGVAEGHWAIVVTVDTQRADHVSCHGYPRPTTPYLDSLAAEGVRFSNFFSHCGSTYPSHTTLFTSLELPQHGVLSNHHPAVDPGVHLLAETFREAGYATGGFVSIYVLEALSRGFSTFDGEYIEKRRYRWAADTVERAIAWLQQRKKTEDVFLWVHVFDPHEWMSEDEPHSHVEAMQFESPEMREELYRYWTEEQRKAIDVGRPSLHGNKDHFIKKQDNYDSKCWYTDDCLRRLFGFLKEHGPSENQVWVVTSDHGESLGNHKYDQHAQYLYNEILHVPLIVRFGDGSYAGKVIEDAASHVDLMPTLAEIIGAQAKQAQPIQGHSLLPLIRGDAGYKPANVFGHRQHKHPEFETSLSWSADPVYCLHNIEYKYVVNTEGPDEFYDLRTDPFELVNLIDKPSSIKDAMREEAVARHGSFEPIGTLDDAPAVTEEDLERLRALGYT